jgi:hypothetical protein
MTLARGLCALACIAWFSACSSGDDALDDTDSRPKDAGTKQGDRDAASGNSGGQGGSAGKSGSGGKGGVGGSSDHDAASETMSDASVSSGGSGGKGGTSASGSGGLSGQEADPTKCGGATCREPSICDHVSEPPVCTCPPGYHYVDVGGTDPPCAEDCEGADCDAGS